MKKLPVVLLLGKLPPPFMGPAIATQLLLNSSLRDHFRLVHLDTRAHQSLSDMGGWSLIKFIRTIAIYLRMKWLLFRHFPDVVVIPVSQSTLGFFKDSLYIWIAKAFFRKVVLHLRGSNFRNWYENSGAVNKWYVRGVLKSVQGVIVQGDKLRSIFEGLVPAHRIHVVPNGADYPIVPSSCDHQPIALLYLANLQSSKGIQDVLEAAALLADKKYPFRLDVVGAWRNEETKRTCLDFVENHRLPVYFHAAASGSDKYRFLEQADVFVFTPRDPEGHPWVIVEAQAAGLPIVATDRGAIAEAVSDGVNGFIVDTNSPGQIAEKLIELIDNRELRKRMGLAARKTYEIRYTESAMVANMTTALHAVIENK